MSKFLRVLCLSSVALLAIASTLQAQQPGGRGTRGAGMRGPTTQLPRGLETTDDQKAKFAEIDKKHADKLKAAQDKAKLTEEQTKARTEAVTKAREENKTGADREAAIAAAVKLTDDQKKGQEELTALVKVIVDEKEALLTDEQKAKLKELRAAQPMRGGRGTRGARNPSTT